MLEVAAIFDYVKELLFIQLKKYALSETAKMHTIWEMNCIEKPIRWRRSSVGSDNLKMV